MPKSEYFELLKNSKIALSPWGNGEWCWRDFEAIFTDMRKEARKFLVDNWDYAKYAKNLADALKKVFRENRKVKV